MPTDKECAAMLRLWKQVRSIVEKDVRTKIALRMVGRGKTQREIAQELGISRETLNRYLKERGREGS